MEPWKRTLLAVCLSQFFSLCGFSFALPFVPYYLQTLGVTDPVALKMWVAGLAAAGALTLMLFAPIWGYMADRYGRRLMMLRANFAGVAILALMATARVPETLLVLRLLQGVFTGTISAAQTMISSVAPREKAGFALGALSASVFSGNMAGSFIGGLFAEAFGYRPAFVASSGLLLVAALLIVFGTREPARPQRRPEPAAAAEGAGRPAPMRQLSALGAWPILALMMVMAAVCSFDSSLLPLLVQKINLDAIEGAAWRTGVVYVAGSVGSILAGVFLGRLADRVYPPRVAKASALGAGLFMIPMGLAQGVFLLVSARLGVAFCAGGLDPVFQIWLAKITPEHRRGQIFGWATAAKSFGWFVAPLASGAIAAGFGIRSIYFVGAVLFWLLIPAIALAVRRLPLSTPEAEATRAER
jgi:DHA1 family multidrug resistance protein-like MFS transporter